MSKAAGLLSLSNHRVWCVTWLWQSKQWRVSRIVFPSTHACFSNEKWLVLPADSQSRSSFPNRNTFLFFFSANSSGRKAARRVTQRSGQRPARASSSVFPCDVPPFTSKVRNSLTIPEYLQHIHTGSGIGENTPPPHSRCCLGRSCVRTPLLSGYRLELLLHARTAATTTSSTAGKNQDWPSDGPTESRSWGGGCVRV